MVNDNKENLSVKVKQMRHQVLNHTRTLIEISGCCIILIQLCMLMYAVSTYNTPPQFFVLAIVTISCDAYLIN